MSPNILFDDFFSPPKVVSFIFGSITLPFSTVSNCKDFYLYLNVKMIFNGSNIYGLHFLLIYPLNLRLNINLSKYIMLKFIFEGLLSPPHDGYLEVSLCVFTSFFCKRFNTIWFFLDYKWFLLKLLVQNHILRTPFKLFNF